MPLSRQLLKVIEYTNTRHDTIIFKFPMDSRAEIMNGSSLTVREGQVAIFMKDGRIADVFSPGRYRLTTANLPVLTTLMSWSKGFKSPFRCDVFFVDTTQFNGQRWGTTNPITMRCKDFGMIRVRGNGIYSFRVIDAKLFMQTMAGARKEFTTEMINDHLRGIILSKMTDVIADSGYSALDLSSKLTQFNEIAQKSLNVDFTAIGLSLASFAVSSVTFPEQVERAIDKSSTLGILGNQMHTYTAMAQADALRDAANNPGMAGAMFGMGVMGGLGNNMMGGMMGVQQQPQQQPVQQQPQQPAGGAFCGQCGAQNPAGAKFCSGCGNKKPGGNNCSQCGTATKPNAKFCAKCGTKI